MVRLDLVALILEGTGGLEADLERVVDASAKVGISGALEAKLGALEQRQRHLVNCQSASVFDPGSACNFDPLRCAGEGST
jgi:hypothetical protein